MCRQMSSLSVCLSVQPFDAFSVVVCRLLSITHSCSSLTLRPPLSRRPLTLRSGQRSSHARHNTQLTPTLDPHSKAYLSKAPQKPLHCFAWKRVSELLFSSLSAPKGHVISGHERGPEMNVSSEEDDLLFPSLDSSSHELAVDVLHVLLAVVGVLLSVLTIVGNVLVMIAFKVDKGLQTISNYFLLSLALADFLIGCISMPLSLVYILSNGWPLGPLLCDAWLAIDYLNSNASVLNLLLISFDRYFSVTRPLTYRARRTTRRACAMIAGAWLVSALLWPPWIFAWPAIEGRRTVPRDQCYIPFLESNIWVTISTALIAFWLPVSLMCILYWRIWRETERRYKDLTTLVLVSHSLSSQSSRSSHAPTSSHASHRCWRRCCVQKGVSSTSINAPSTETPPTSESIYTIVIQLERANCGEHNATVTMLSAEDEEEAPPSPPPMRLRAPIQPKSERKAAKTLSAILLAFIVTWTPYNILVFVKTFSPSSVDSDGVWWQFAYYLCYINSTLNPLCYALCNVNFRNTYIRILTCRLQQRGTTAQQQQATQQQLSSRHAIAQRAAQTSRHK